MHEGARRSDHAGSARARVVVVLAGGEPARPVPLPPGAAVVAADAGIHQAAALDLGVDVLIGDMDSVEPAALRAARAAGVRIEAHPADKDETDLELALAAALDLGAERVLVLGGGGGRLDHLLANAGVLCSPRWSGVHVEAVFGADRLHVVRGEASLRGRPGSLVTLLAVHAPARGVTTQGLRFPLHDAELAPGTGRGVSNELLGTEGAVAVAEGVVLVVQPGAIE